MEDREGRGRGEQKHEEVVEYGEVGEEEMMEDGERVWAAKLWWKTRCGAETSM